MMVGMKIFEAIVSWFLQDKQLAGLSEDQSLAIVDALVSTVIADGRVTSEEWDSLRREIARLPWAWQGEREDSEARRAFVERKVEDARAHLSERLAHIQDGSLARDIAKRLPDPAIRRKVFTMVAAVAQVDGIAKSESDELETFRQAFELSEADAKKLLIEVRDRFTGALE
jgi:uncharacterized tellurite resistance protein B-like protein